MAALAEGLNSTCKYEMSLYNMIQNKLSLEVIELTSPVMNWQLDRGVPCHHPVVKCMNGWTFTCYVGFFFT